MKNEKGMRHVDMRYKIFPSAVFTREVKWESELLRLAGRLLSRKQDVYDRSSRTTISQATTLKRTGEKERGRETRAVYLRADIAKTCGASCTYDIIDRSTDI